LNKYPVCESTEKQSRYQYSTKNFGNRTMFECVICGCTYSETKNSFIHNLKTPISTIWQVINNRTEGQGLNATARVSGVAKNTILSWERKFTELYQVLFVYAIGHCFFQLVIEGDEFYTKVKKNVPQDQSSGWTIVLMDRASRFIWASYCGKKDRSLFRKTIKKIEKLVNQTGDFSLITDGERRYDKILFEICNDLIKNGKPGRPKKTLKKGVKVRIKNKGSQAHKRGRKRPKYQAPCPEHPETKQEIDNKDIHVNHLEANNSAMRRKCSPFRRKTNTYAKSTGDLQRILNVYWVIHNFERVHFTLKEVPAVSLGIIKKRLLPKELFEMKLC
jgi:transposase-like protein